MFGLQNATITAVYIEASQGKDIYGAVSLDSSTAMNHRCWIEDVADERRRSGGDTFENRAKIYTDYATGLDEGNIITVVPDSFSGEPSQETLNWRIENRSKHNSSSFGNSRLFRVILDVIQEK